MFMNDATPRCYLKWDLDVGDCDKRQDDLEARRAHRESYPYSLSTATFEGGTVFVLTDDFGKVHLTGYYVLGYRRPMPERISGVLWTHQRVRSNSPLTVKLLTKDERNLIC